MYFNNKAIESKFHLHHEKISRKLESKTANKNVCKYNSTDRSNLLQRKRKRRSHSRRTAHVNGLVMGFDYMFYNGQPQS